VEAPKISLLIRVRIGINGGLLYAAANFVDAPGLSGVLSFDTDGNPSQLTTELRRGFQLEFDTTEGKVFDGLLYVLGNREWSGDTAVFRVHPDGQIEEFITGIYFRSELEFGPDNSLYVLEANFQNNDVTISRVALIPEPATALFLIVGGGLLRKRKRASL